MNEHIKRLAKEAYEKVPMGNKQPDVWLDEFIIEYSRKVIFECSDVVRASAKNKPEDIKGILRASAVDILDHFDI